MALLGRKNFSTSLVATAPSPATSGTSLVVTAATGTLFPTVPFYAVICPAATNATAANAEVILVTAVSTDTFTTIVRAQDGSTARSVIVGDQIYVAPVAGYLISRDTDNNASINNVLEGYATTATAAGTTTLTVASAYQQYFTGTTTQTVVLPDATTLTLGHEFIVINRSTGNVTVNKNGGALSLVVVPEGIAYFQVTNIGSAAGTWDTTFIPKMVGSGSAVLTYPSSTDTLVGRATTDTLTNKRIDPVTNTMVGCVYSLTANQAATAATTVLVGATWTMPANFASVGTVIRVKIFYRFVKTTSPPTLTCNLNVGGASVTQIIITSVSSAITAGGMLEATLTVITTGAGGTMMCALVGSNDHGITNATNWNPQLVDIATDAIDTTASKVVSVDMKMTTGVSNNILTISQGYVEIVKL